MRAEEGGRWVDGAETRGCGVRGKEDGEPTLGADTWRTWTGKGRETCLCVKAWRWRGSGRETGWERKTTPSRRRRQAGFMGEPAKGEGLSTKTERRAHGTAEQRRSCWLGGGVGWVPPPLSSSTLVLSWKPRS